MYLPEAFAEQDRDIALSIIRENPFATVITAQGGVEISQAPALVDVLDGQVTARVHLASRNPQCRALEDGATCVALFSGPDCYVSPTWYAEHPNVPTWNYLSVELRCSVRRMARAELEQLLQHLSAVHEAVAGGDWNYERLPVKFRDELLDEIAGFWLEAREIRCKLKLSQNRTAEDRRSVTGRLLESSDARAREVGRWMVRLSERNG